MNIVIMDASVVRMKATNPLEEGLFLVDLDKDEWCKNHQNAKKYEKPEDAITVAKLLAPNLHKPPRVFQVQQNGPNINITEFKYQ